MIEVFFWTGLNLNDVTLSDVFNLRFIYNHSGDEQLQNSEQLTFLLVDQEDD